MRSNCSKYIAIDSSCNVVGGYPLVYGKIRGHTLEVSSFTSMLGWLSQASRLAWAVFCTSWSRTRLRFSGPKSRSTRVLRCLWKVPSVAIMQSAPMILMKDSGYQIWNSLSSFWNTKLFSSWSRETMRSSPIKFVLKIGPYLKLNTMWIYLYCVYTTLIVHTSISINIKIKLPL